MSLKIIPIKTQKSIIKKETNNINDGTTQVMQSNEIKDIILTMNDMSMHPETKTSKIDPFTNLEEHHVNNMARWNYLGSHGVIGYDSMGVTTDIKVMRISIKREGRKEIVEMNKANLDNQANKALNPKKWFGVQ